MRKICLIKIDVEGYTDMVIDNQDFSIFDNAIIEFSIGDTANRLNGDDVNVRHEFIRTAKFMSHHMPYVYYISKFDGLVEINFNSFDDYFFIVQMEHSVGDLLFCKTSQPSISLIGFLTKKILNLMSENHLRILENQRVAEILENQRVAE